VYRQELATSHHNLGVLLAALGEQVAARQAYRRALDLQEKLVADSPAVPAYRQELAKSHHSLGDLLAELGQWAAAEQAYRRALSLREQLAAELPAVPAYRQELARTYNGLGSLLAELGRKPAAEQAYRRALDLKEKLAAEFPSVPAHRQDLAGSCVNFGHLLRDQGQAEASLAWFDKAVALLEPLVRQEPRLVTGRLFLRNAHWGRAEALDKLGRHADAVKDWDRALELNALQVDEPGLRSGRARTLARAGEHARAVAEANALAEAKDVTGDTLYDLTCVCAIAAAGAKDAQTPGADARRLAEGYAARAVELLRRALAKGFQGAARVNKDKDLDALRERADFKELLAEWQARKK
jgi:tetratricopeptide (TPR) repeat protein